MGLPSLGADEPQSSLSFQASWQACSLLPPGESQVYRRNSIRGQGKGLLWGCVCWWCICVVCCIHVVCAWVPYIAHVCMLLFTEPEPCRLKPKPLCPPPSRRGGGQDTRPHLLPNPSRVAVNCPRTAVQPGHLVETQRPEGGRGRGGREAPASSACGNRFPAGWVSKLCRGWG